MKVRIRGSDASKSSEVVPLRTAAQVLREAREKRRMSLEEVAQITRIPLRTLQALEEERQADLPGSVFLRGFLRAYAVAVKISPDEILAMHHEQSQEMDAMALREGGNAFSRYNRSAIGLAIALIVLLILLALAISMVARPRPTNAPLEMSAKDGFGPAQQVLPHHG